jgi:hypothetical protein
LLGAFADAFEIIDKALALGVAIFFPRMRSKRLGWIVTQHSPPSASVSGWPRVPLMVTTLPIRDRAALAPSATVTGGLMRSRSWSIHQRQAWISPPLGLL